MWTHPVLALVLAMLFAFLLVGALGWRRPSGAGAGASLLFLLLLLFPLLWAAAVWTGPAGPMVFGTAIVGPILIGLLFALLIAAVMEPGRPPARPGRDTDAAGVDAAVTAFGAMFWILLMIAIGVIIAGYLV